MTEEQKKSVLLLNGLLDKSFIDDEEYFTLLQFIVGREQQPVYVPFPAPQWPQPLTSEPYYLYRDKVTCTINDITDGED